jgi:capsular polysaccharide transport system ATP-binding protein
MSITLRNIRKKSTSRGQVYTLFDGLDLDVEKGARIGILGPAKSGKSTLLRLICGTEFPDSGRVVSGLRVSWPIPLSTFIIDQSPMVVSIRFIARLYGVKDADFPRRVAESVGIADFLNVKLSMAPATAKGRLAFALGVWTDFDVYLFDDRLVPREKELQEQATALLDERLKERGYVLTSATTKDMEGRCDSIYVLEGGRAIHFADPAAGITYFNEVFGPKKNAKGAKAETRDDDADSGDGESNDIDLVTAAISAVDE